MAVNGPYELGNSSTMLRSNINDMSQFHQAILNAIVYANVQKMNVSSHLGAEVGFINSENIKVSDLDGVNNHTLIEGGILATIKQENLSCYEIRYYVITV